MKILHTADWHLGKMLDNFSRLDEQRDVLNEICEIADQQAVDVVIVAGDLFDGFAPSSAATELLYSTLHRLSANGTRAVVAIAGNHDSPERIEVPDALARACGIVFVGFPNVEIAPFKTQGGISVLKTDKGFLELQLPNCDTPLRLLLTPYANEVRLKTFLGMEQSERSLREYLQEHWENLANKYCDNEGVNILVTHLFLMKRGGEKSEEPDDEKPILYVGGASEVYSENIPAQIQYVALGHLHRYQVIDKIPCPMVYSSSPLAYSFAEANQSKFVVLLDCQANKPIDYQAIELKKGKKLLRAKFEKIDDALLWLAQNQDALVQITIVTDTYLEAADKRRLLEAHPMMMPIIPELRKKQSNENLKTKALASLGDQGMEEVFRAYFEYKKGQSPNEEIMSVFKELLAGE